jgi:L-alanine-DL-glutamate epimerase-like enolase superfamily enzyme
MSTDQSDLINAGSPAIGKLTTAVYRFPTPEPEADGTLEWDATVAVAVTVHGGDRTGFGWTYSGAAAAHVINDNLVDAVTGREAFDIAGGWAAMHRACRNLGTRGLVMQAISAVDIAWWDLKAQLVNLPLTTLMGQVHAEVPVYGSGGFTTLTDEQLANQVADWQAAGCTAMKIKIGEAWGTRIDRDLMRVRQLRDLAGPEAELMVDANGAYCRGQARRVGAELDDLGVTWFEEPVSCDDTAGLGVLRDALNCDIAAGEYAADLYEIGHLIPVVDCLQLDVTRCGGYTGWLRGAALAQAHNLDVSGHCAPALHAPVAAAIPNFRHLEWFADHARLEQLLVDGAPTAADGVIRPNRGQPGHGMRLSENAARWAAK